MGLATLHLQNLLGRRSLVTIPNDQQNLLEKKDSWAVDLKAQPHGLANIPGHVLESVKAAHLRQRGSKGPPVLTQSTPPPKPINGGSKSCYPESQAIQSQVPPPSSPEREISWSLSPHKEPPARPAAVESPIVEETPNGKAALMAPPPRPAPTRPPVLDCPSSSGIEDELETELPQAQVHHDAPVNRAASRLQAVPPSSPGPTDSPPPCAQQTQGCQPVTIPSTVVQEPAPRDDTTTPRRKRRMKEIHFSDEPAKRIRQTLERLPGTNPFQEVISPNSTPSSSIIPATMPSHPPIISSIEGDKDQVHTQIRPQKEVEPTQTRTPVSRSNPRLSEISLGAEAQISISSDMKPFDAFCAAYPAYTESYSGTLWDFIKACVILDYLRRRRMLREYLYDDFIRAFADGFQPYVRNAGPHQEPLEAIEWYNNLSGPPSFRRMVVTKENIGFILDVYPQEADKANQIVNIGRKNKEEEVVIYRPMPAPRSVSHRVAAFAAAKSTNSTPLQPPRTQEPSTQPPSQPLSQTAPPSSIASPVLSRKSPAISQRYLKPASSAGTNRRRSMEERARLREHLRKRRSLA